MNKLTIEEELYDMPQAEIDGLKERLAMLSRSVRAKGLEEFRFANYEIGEDLETGNLCVDTFKITKRKVLGKGEVEQVNRTYFMMIDRYGNMMVCNTKRHLLKQLHQSLVLEELAQI